MTTHNCPAGHDSVDPDFCSECGTQLAPAPGSAPAAPAADPASAPSTSSSSAGHENCPKCSEVRDGSAQFCGVCGYDYVNKTGGEVPQAAPASVAPTPSFAPPAVPSPSVAPASLSSARIDLEVVVGKTGPRKHSLFDNENLIGRPNNKVALSLVIDGDEGISRRQMMITRQADGSVTVRDLDSANGTKVEHDGGTVTVAVGEERPIVVGDKIIIGEHTVVTIIAIVI